MKNVKLYHFLFISLISVSLGAIASDECTIMVYGMNNYLMNETDEQISDFKEEVEELKANYLNSIRSSKSKSFDAFSKEQMELHKYFYTRNLLKAALPKVIKNIPFSNADKHYCNNEYALKKLIDGRLEGFELVIEETLAAIEQRAELENLRENEGLVVIAVYVNGYAEQIKLKEQSFAGDEHVIGPIQNAQHFEVIKLEAGTYAWERIKERIPNGFMHFDFTEADLSFEVQPGKLNLAGVLNIHRGVERIHASLLDRSAILIELLKDNYPLILNELPWTNALSHSDPFPLFYSTEKQTLGVK